MRPAWTRAGCVALLAGALAFARWGAPAPECVVPAASGIGEIAERLNIRNLVAAVYLGPRAVDTFLEVMVVTLAVVGMRFARGARP